MKYQSQTKTDFFGKLSKYKWEIFLGVSIIIILICWLLRDDTNKPTEEDNQIFFDPNLIPQNITPKDDRKGKRTESICRGIVERIYMRPFPSIRPDFLKNPKTGRNLELDMYNDDLKLAIEYNGQQHHHYSPYFHKTYEDFLDQIERDQYKKEKCYKLGITLISIPYTVRKEDLETYIVKELKSMGKL